MFATRAARLFILFSALVSLYFGVLVVSAVVLAQVPNKVTEIHVIDFG